MEGEKKSGCSGSVSCVSWGIGTGVVSNLLGADIQTAALIGGGISAALPAIGSTVATIATGALGMGKRATLAVAGIGLSATVLAGGIGSGASAGSHKLTDLVIDRLPQRFAVEEQAEEAMASQKQFDDTYEYQS